MITFILNNKTIKTPENSGMTLLDFVRYQQRLTGTKIGCREGDCGACTVLVGTLNSEGFVEYQSITSCISPLGNAHGKHIVTVEGTNLQNKLTATQHAMKANYATQCGFCTPGFVVALTGFALSNSDNNYTNALDAISGNICRCTGYKSIERAARDVVEKLENKKHQSFSWLIDNDFIPAYFETIPDRLKDLELKDLNQPKGKFVSGGTDLYVQQADNLIDNSVHLIAEKDYLKGIKIEKHTCTIGTNSTVSDLWNHTELNTHFPNLKNYLKLVSSEQIRNMASFGGNLVNASPIGDMTILFLALNSDITITTNNQKERTVALKNFYQDYKTFDLKESELIKNISFNLPTKHSYFNFEKVSKRTHLDIASVNSAIYIAVEKEVILEAHVAIGGVAAIPKYLHKTSAFLSGKPLTSTTILEASDRLQNEISPISDVRGSDNYKRLLARQLFFAHFIALFPKLFTLNDFVQHA
ncbi:FAD binding domain-containing protein [Winogradskyella bathintestinalis]|uniref:FAD binding domain-containing protein n=1 Tax=Winogradskyella bathintestinalis TaxID=3035208 RepID=A0ABT7ZQ73_9FLAO|nr:FAD binding domain-containing protein [Winogradskyella bathintestinalis]MDN3491171.1 FAD binding domain-containing protein [Winogradskyella bathintestinalis]